MQLFGDLDILSFVIVSRLTWIGHGNRMDSKRNVSQAFDNIPQGSRLRGQRTNRWWNCVQTGINNCQFKSRKGRLRSRAALWEKSIKETMVRIVFCAIEEEEEEEEIERRGGEEEVERRRGGGGEEEEEEEEEGEGGEEVERRGGEEEEEENY